MADLDRIRSVCFKQYCSRISQSFLSAVAEYVYQNCTDTRLLEATCLSICDALAGVVTPDTVYKASDRILISGFYTLAAQLAAASAKLEVASEEMLSIQEELEQSQRTVEQLNSVLLLLSNTNPSYIELLGLMETICDGKIFSDAEVQRYCDRQESVGATADNHKPNQEGSVDSPSIISEQKLKGQASAISWRTLAGSSSIALMQLPDIMPYVNNFLDANQIDHALISGFTEDFTMIRSGVFSASLKAPLSEVAVIQPTFRLFLSALCHSLPQCVGQIVSGAGEGKQKSIVASVRTAKGDKSYTNIPDGIVYRGDYRGDVPGDETWVNHAKVLIEAKAFFRLAAKQIRNIRAQAISGGIGVAQKRAQLEQGKLPKCFWMFYFPS